MRFLLLAIIGDPLKSERTSSLVEAIHAIVIECWLSGVKSKNTEDPDFDLIKVAGNPWNFSFRSEESSVARLMVARIFEEMLARGWRVSRKQCTVQRGQTVVLCVIKYI